MRAGRNERIETGDGLTQAAGGATECARRWWAGACALHCEERRRHHAAGPPRWFSRGLQSPSTQDAAP
eukprot:scaffold3032_cov375-Prasinococcus_capsulatus_cf.AAC.8